jgi:phenylalanyl-tRNA synthetase beta chain
MLGAPVDEIVDLGGPLRDIVIGRVDQAERHPNADRLSLCTWTPAAATAAGRVRRAERARGCVYPFAPVGATLPGGMTIRKAKIRGEESQGMLCSARELGSRSRPRRHPGAARRPRRRALLHRGHGSR